MTDESHIVKLTQQAESCLDRGELAEARRLYADICRVHDNDTHAWTMFGAINGELGNIEVAQNALERAITIDSTNAEAHLVLAHVLRAKGQPGKAMDSASRAVEADAKFVDGWLFVAAMSGRIADWPRAEEACRHVIELAPDSKEGHVNLGNVLLATGRAPLAEETFRKALALGESAEAWFGLGSALGAQNRHAEAESALTTALRLDTGNTDFRNALAACLDRLGRSSESTAVRSGLGHT